jgi:hypothetical protein
MGSHFYFGGSFLCVHGWRCLGAASLGPGRLGCEVTPDTVSVGCAPIRNAPETLEAHLV